MDFKFEYYSSKKCCLYVRFERFTGINSWYVRNGLSSIHASSSSKIFLLPLRIVFSPISHLSCWTALRKKLIRLFLFLLEFRPSTTSTLFKYYKCVRSVIIHIPRSMIRLFILLWDFRAYYLYTLLRNCFQRRLQNIRASAKLSKWRTVQRLLKKKKNKK